MFKANDVWLPDGETHLVDMMLRKGPYQIHKYKAALDYVKNFRTAIDVGAHAGIWSMYMAEDFEHIIAFEPVRRHRACYVMNVQGSYTLHPYACGNINKKVGVVEILDSTGDAYITDGSNVDMVKIDDFDLKGIDFIKLDCEGYELFALEGAEQTLLNNHPVVIVEQKKPERYGADAVSYLTDLGMTVKEAITGDFILTWE